MTLPERTLPSPRDLADRIRQRIQVRLEHDLRELDQRERARRQQDLLPLVEELAKSEEGRLELAIVLSTYLKQSEKDCPAAPREPERDRESESAAPAPEPRASKPGRKRRRRRKSGPRN